MYHNQENPSDVFFNLEQEKMQMFGPFLLTLMAGVFRIITLGEGKRIPWGTDFTHCVEGWENTYGIPVLLAPTGSQGSFLVSESYSSSHKTMERTRGHIPNPCYDYYHHHHGLVDGWCSTDC